MISTHQNSSETRMGEWASFKFPTLHFIDTWKIYSRSFNRIRTYDLRNTSGMPPEFFKCL